MLPHAIRGMRPRRIRSRLSGAALADTHEEPLEDSYEVARSPFRHRAPSPLHEAIEEEVQIWVFALPSEQERYAVSL
jgi:hypothetical protein